MATATDGLLRTRPVFPAEQSRSCRRGCVSVLCLGTWLWDVELLPACGCRLCAWLPDWGLLGEPWLNLHPSQALHMRLQASQSLEAPQRASPLNLSTALAWIRTPSARVKLMGCMATVRMPRLLPLGGGAGQGQPLLQNCLKSLVLRAPCKCCTWG